MSSKKKKKRHGPSPHLPQLLACCLVLSALTQILHALVLGQEVLLLGVHFVTIPLVEQFAEGDVGLVGLGGGGALGCLPRLWPLRSSYGCAWLLRALGFNGKPTELSVPSGLSQI